MAKDAVLFDLLIVAGNIFVVVTELDKDLVHIIFNRKHGFTVSGCYLSIFYALLHSANRLKTLCMVFVVRLGRVYGQLRVSPRIFALKLQLFHASITTFLDLGRLFSFLNFLVTESMNIHSIL